MRVVILNCTLKRSGGGPSLTQVLCQQAATVFHELRTEAEIIRVADFRITPGQSPYESETDEWPLLLDKILTADVLLIATPARTNNYSSLTQRIFERLETDMSAGQHLEPTRGQPFTYNKVAGAIAAGAPACAKAVGLSVIAALADFGFTIGASPLAFESGRPAGAPPSADASQPEFAIRVMVHNILHVTALLRENPYAINLTDVAAVAKAEQAPQTSHRF